MNRNSYRVALDFTGVLKTTNETHTVFIRGTEQRPRYMWQKRYENTTGKKGRWTRKQFSSTEFHPLVMKAVACPAFMDLIFLLNCPI